MNKVLKASAVALIAITSLASINTALAGCGADHKEQAAKSIYETAKEAGFTTLIAAVDAANLGETLTEGGPFTVFAPTDEAFAMLPEGALEGLLADKDALSNVLLYHVTSGGVLAEDVVKIASAKMLNGSDAAIDTREGVKIAGVQIKQTDIIASNGVIHIIDAVMLPTND